MSSIVHPYLRGVSTKLEALQTGLFGERLPSKQCTRAPLFEHGVQGSGIEVLDGCRRCGREVTRYLLLSL
jgi:hypothetical protein